MRQAIVTWAERRERGQHPGLILNRFLAAPATGQNGDPEERCELIRSAIVASRSQALVELYTRAYSRWKAGLPQPPTGIVTDEVLRTEGRLIVGLGNESVLETGLGLHHTYGVPVIPGSALKGLASHYCDQVWGLPLLGEEAPRENKDYRLRAPFHNLLFGTTADGGVIRFENAWILPASLTAAKEGLLRDVMTPHHPDWQTDPTAPPTDFDSPVPVPYVSVAGRFHVAVAWQGPEHPDSWKWTARGFFLLKEALKEWGIGGKTSSGYGRMSAFELGTSAAGPSADKRTLTAKARGPAHRRGEKIAVTRIEGGKGKVRFRADDGFAGHVAAGEPPPVEVGKTVELWVANVSPEGYTLSTTEPALKQRSQPDRKRGR